MTESIRESEQIPGEPASNGPSTEAVQENPPPPAAPAASEFPPAESPVIDKIRRRVRTQTQGETDRMRTLEERMMRLEELLTARAAAAPPPPVSVAEVAPLEEDTPVAEIAPPLAPVLPEAPVATFLGAPMASIAPASGDAASALTKRGWRSWFVMQSLRQAFNNFRLFLRMYVDPRYRMTWLGRLVPLAFVLFLVFSDWDWRVFEFIFFWNMIPFGIGSIVNKLVLVVFAWVTVKVLGFEMRRYQEVVPDVPEALRWGNR